MLVSTIGISSYDVDRTGWVQIMARIVCRTSCESRLLSARSNRLLSKPFWWAHSMLIIEVRSADRSPWLPHVIKYECESMIIELWYTLHYHLKEALRPAWSYPPVQLSDCDPLQSTASHHVRGIFNLHFGENWNSSFSARLFCNRIGRCH